MITEGIMEKKMETLGPSNGIYRHYIRGIYWGYIGIMEKKMETTNGHVGIIGYFRF